MARECTMTNFPCCPIWFSPESIAVLLSSPHVGSTWLTHCRAQADARVLVSCSGLPRSSGSWHCPRRAPVLRSSEPLLMGSDCSLGWVALGRPCCQSGPVSWSSSLACSSCGLVSCSTRFLHSPVIEKTLLVCGLENVLSCWSLGTDD